MRFIYIMKEKDRDILLQHGYTLVKGDDLNHIWILDEDGADHVDEEQLQHFIRDRYVLSNTLSL